MGDINPASKFGQLKVKGNFDNYQSLSYTCSTNHKNNETDGRFFQILSPSHNILTLRNFVFPA